MNDKVKLIFRQGQKWLCLFISEDHMSDHQCGPVNSSKMFKMPGEYVKPFLILPGSPFISN